MSLNVDYHVTHGRLLDTVLDVKNDLGLKWFLLRFRLVIRANIVQMQTYNIT